MIKKIFFITKKIVIGVCFFLSLLAIFSANYLLECWGELGFSTVLYQLSTPLQGTSEEVLTQYRQYALIPTITIWCIIVFLWVLFFYIFDKLQFGLKVNICGKKFNIKCGYKKKYTKLKTIKNSMFSIIGISNVIVLLFFANKIGMVDYIKDMMNPSTIFEEEYVSPNEVDIVFREKRNLVYIYLESMESTFMSQEKGGGMMKNHIPNLTSLAENNISFSDKEILGGLNSVTGAQWTMGALVGGMTGIPYKLPIEGNSASEYTEILPGVVSLGEILEDNGYKNYFACGSDIAFGGRGLFLIKHGNYEIYDYAAAIRDGLIDKDYREYWGIEDDKLYQYVKEKLNVIGNSGESFNFTFLTVDTHHPKGYICNKCKNTYENDLENAIACADEQVLEFLEWIKEQEWYEDTTIVISGDHLSMENMVLSEIPYENRKIYNCFLNTKVDAKEEKNRQACIFDMLPTTLAAIGAEIEGNRLGLGTNLFSDRKTLIEEMGLDEFNSQTNRYSYYYDEVFIKGK